MVDNTKDAIAGQDELGDAIAGAGKKAKRGVAGFDEVNQLQEEMAGGGAGAGGIAETEVINDEQITQAEEGVSKFEEMFKTIKEKLNPTLESLRGNVTRITEALKPMFKEIWKLIKVVSKEMSPVFKEVFDFALVVLRNFGNTLEYIFKTSALIIEKTVKIIRQILEGDFKGAFNTVGELLKGLLENFKLYFSQIITSTWEALVRIGNIIKINLQQIFEYWGNLFSSLRKIFASWGASIGLAWESFWIDLVKKVAEWVVNVIKFWRDLKIKLSEIVNNIKTSTINTFTKMGIGIGKIWTSIKDTTKQTWAGIWNVVKGFINLIIAGINKIIEAWNSLEFKLPKKTFDVFGKKVEFGGQSVGTRNIRSITPLSTGGNVQSTNQAQSQSSSLLGNESIDQLGKSIIDALQGGKDTIINIDGKKIGRAMIPILNNENSRTGSRTVIQTG
jgi:hypothetical protein